MRSKKDPEIRLSVRLKGPLAQHADRQVESHLFESHSEYIRALVRRDMQMTKEPGEEELRQKIINGYRQLAKGEYQEVSNESLFERAVQELRHEGYEMQD